MKFLTTTYHHHLLGDWERLAAFYEAIKIRSRGVVFDLGAGSGILSYFAAYYSKIIYAVELDPKAAAHANFNLKDRDNIHIINSDAREFNFPCKADLIICEMLDTALIDEEQVPVMNKAIDYLHPQGEVIPAGVFKGVELVNMKTPQTLYEDSFPDYTQYQIRSPLLIYRYLSFYQKNQEDFKEDIIFRVKESGKVNGLKLTMFTLLSSDLLCGPTSMFNPPLFIPVDELELKKEDKIKINLKYTMGSGLDTIKTKVEEIF